MPQNGRLEVQVRVKPFLSDGTYWCALTAHQVLSATTKVGIYLPIYATFVGTERPRLVLEALGREENRLKLLLFNGGNVLLPISGTIRLYDPKEEKAVLQVPPLALLPGERRAVSIPMDAPPGLKLVVLLETPYNRVAAEGVW